MKTVLRLFFIALMILAVSPETGHAQGFKYVEVTVLDLDGKPMPEAELQINMDGMRFPMPTDDEGKVAFNVPAGENSRVQIGVQMDGYLAQGAAWEKGEEIPDSFTIPMKKGVSIGGIVHDEEGNPIEGVLVEGIMVFNSSTQLPGGGKLQPYFYGELATTDAQGHWEVKSAPEHEIELQLKFSHPDYVSDRGYGFRGGSWSELRSQKKVVVLEKGIILTGTVTDEGDNPIAGAKLGLGKDYVNDDAIVRSDSDGKYRFNSASAGSDVLTVFADGYAPDMRTVTLTKDMEPVDFMLQSGHTIKFHVTDPDGNPIQGAGIAADTWRDCRALMSLATRGKTDADGNWRWDHAPADKIQFDLFCQGHMSVRGEWFAPQEQPHEVTMPWPVKVSGEVIDAESGAPIDTFQVVQGIRFEGNDRIYWQRYDIQAGHEGKYELIFDEPRQANVIRIEAAGYRPGISRDIQMDEGEITIDFRLEEGSGPTGMVKLPDGSSAAGAEVLMSTVGSNQIYLSNGRNQRQSDTPSITTDDAGRFTLPFPEGDFTIVALHDAGWAQVDGTPDTRKLDVQLEPWGRVEGIALCGQRPRSEEPVTLYYNIAYNRDRPYVYWSYSTVTDREGKFAFDRVRSGPGTVALNVSYGGDGGRMPRMSTYSHATPVDVKQGETTHLQLGGEGLVVHGELTVPAGVEESVAWNMGYANLSETSGPQNVAGLFHALGKAIAASSAWNSSSTVQPQTPRRSYAAAIDDQGQFEFADIPPGTYRLTVTIYQVQEGQNFNWNPHATFNQTVVVPESDDNQPIDLGDLELTMSNPSPSAATATGTFRLYAAPLPAQ